ncbi:MAG: tetratricopeptide repeat protein [Rudaea sp.]
MPRAPGTPEGDHGYTLQDVERLLGLPKSIVRALIDAGFVAPLRGRRREFRFSFQDLVVLRTAQGLVEAKLPTARILRSLRRLRTQLPPQMPMSGLRVEAVGDAIVVREGNAQWQPDDGQYLLRFHVESPGGRLAFLDPSPSAPAPSGDELFERASELEESNPAVACGLYREAIAAEPGHAAAYINLGRLLHARGQWPEAETAYREGLTHCGPDATLYFNLALVLEDLHRAADAADAYRAALREDPALPEAHYNLALLCEAAGLRQEAFRHLSAYRRLGKKR